MQFNKISNDIVCKPHQLLGKWRRHDNVRPAVCVHWLVERSNMGAAKGSGLRCALAFDEVVMKFSYTPSRRLLVVYCALRETVYGFLLAKIRYKTRKNCSKEEFRRIYPHFSVRVFLLSYGAMMSYVQVILDYIDQFSSGTELIPEDNLARLPATAWLSYRSAEINKSFNCLPLVNLPRHFLNAGHTQLSRRLTFVELIYDAYTFLLTSKYSAVEADFFTLGKWLSDLSFSLAPTPYIEQFLRRAARRISAMTVLTAARFNQQRKLSPCWSRRHHPITSSNHSLLA